MYRLAINREIGAPCGVPLPLSLLTVVRRLVPLPSSSSTTISNLDLVRASIAPSLTIHQPIWQQAPKLSSGRDTLSIHPDALQS
jgi:hypothetical protein